MSSTSPHNINNRSFSSLEIETQQLYNIYQQKRSTRMAIRQSAEMAMPLAVLAFTSLCVATLSAPTTNCNSGANAIHHGTLVALQLTPTPTEWLSCSSDTSTQCNTSTCPGLYINKEDWTKCNEETIEIYRALGTGEIRVGDLVGLHHPNKPGTWLSCNSTDCKLSGSCLGQPSMETGFYNGVQWPECLEQVFKIHAYNKTESQIIEVGDDVSFRPLSTTSGRLTHRSGGVINVEECQTDSIPERYEQCTSEVFTIWSKP